jgi:hypothetical protein
LNIQKYLYDKFTKSSGKTSGRMDKINKKVVDFGCPANLFIKVSTSIGVSGRSIDGKNRRLKLPETRRIVAFDEVGY